METNNKLREAVVEIIDYLEPIRKWTMPSKENHTRLTALFAAVDTVYTKAKKALAEPVKNCEVGTAEEQAQRFYNFCTEHSSAIQGMCDCGCPCIDSGDKCHCLCKWMQMPYKEGGAK